ncbi:MAG TPA: MerR family transcriptional regulator [Polyangiaceae bacterium]|nr:MerR family transcriptional regulator [Polyangiaceae bacterium]HMR78437.1 MerR family transcriptional regulator [Polyangiaceae bacterium]
MASKRHLALLPESAPESPDLAAELMLVGELAKATGKTVRAIHLYEDLGLLRPQDRSKGRYRLFSHDALLRVRWIVKLQSLGLSLSDIQDVVRDQTDADSAQFAAARLREVYVSKLNETRNKLAELHALERELEQSLNYLDDCDSHCEPAVPTAGCSSCDRHETHAAPELIAGAQAH